MAGAILLYGASGFSGRLIAAEAKKQGMSRSGASAFRMILAGRSASALKPVAEANDMDVRVFSLADPITIRNGLAGIDVVINAAGPMEDTAEPLLEAAIATPCAYVDINGEVEVYLSLRARAQRDDAKSAVIVSGAGASGGVAAVMVDLALAAIATTSAASSDYGAIRVAHTKEFFVSRGSVATILRVLTHQVMVVRSSAAAADGCACCPPPSGAAAMKPANVPVGALERIFDFGALALNEGGRRTGSGFSIVDTLAAWDAALQHSVSVKTIESYEAMGALGRIGYQVVANVPLFFGLPGVQSAAQMAVNLFPEGPTSAEMDAERHAVVIEIDDAFGAHLVDWRLETPNVYRLTAQLAVAAAVGADAIQQAGGGALGWTTVSKVLGTTLASIGTGPLAGCTLDRRLG